MSDMETIRSLLHRLYSPKDASRAFNGILNIIENFQDQNSPTTEYFSQKDIVLITYGDSLLEDGTPPLQTFHRFAKKYFRDIFSTIHFLPFFPFSSDDGFSVTDFFSINPDLGSWADVEAIGNDFELMFDMVLNHVSAKSKWFENYLNGSAGFESLALAVDPSLDLSMVTRPRALPLLTPFRKKGGEEVHVWTTFSSDQIDLNYQNPTVLEKMVEVLLFYVERGARILRFDAIAYLWKEIGTDCIHHPRTHDMVRLFRAILDVVAPSVMILTETNVPHSENISYFGTGRDEAQMVYNFTLPPLLLHTFLTGDARHFSDWAAGLDPPSSHTTFFNFTASHDGIGVRPLEGILPDSDIMKLADRAKSHGAGASLKRNPDGTESPYELNITYLDAILAGETPGDCRDEAKFLASQAVQYALPGVPATYIHSVLGSRNWTEGVRQTGRARSINREKLDAQEVLNKLKNPETFRSRIFFPYLHLIRIRRQQPAFHPKAAMEVLDIHPAVIAVSRASDNQTIYTLTNVSPNHVSFSLAGSGFPTEMKDLLTGNRVKKSATLHLAPYAFLWLTSPESIPNVTGDVSL